MNPLTHDYYLEILDVLKNAQRPLMTVAEFLVHPQQSAIVLRHDVDRWPRQAIRMARLEARLGVKSTYYFRWSPSQGFDQEAIHFISQLGHEVGYHYETFSQRQGNRSAAIDLFRANLQAFRQLAPCLTVSAHGAPLSPHNNFELLTDYPWSASGLVGDAALSLAQNKLVYYTDTGGRWNTGHHLNFRDYVGLPFLENAPSPGNTSGFCAFLDAKACPVYISTHPERWADEWLFQQRAQLKDRAVNGIKMLLHIVRQR